MGQQQGVSVSSADQAATEKRVRVMEHRQHGSGPFRSGGRGGGGGALLLLLLACTAFRLFLLSAPSGQLSLLLQGGPGGGRGRWVGSGQPRGRKSGPQGALHKRACCHNCFRALAFGRPGRRTPSAVAPARPAGTGLRQTTEPTQTGTLNRSRRYRPFEQVAHALYGDAGQAGRDGPDHLLHHRQVLHVLVRLEQRFACRGETMKTNNVVMPGMSAVGRWPGGGGCGLPKVVQGLVRLAQGGGGLSGGLGRVGGWGGVGEREAKR